MQQERKTSERLAFGVFEVDLRAREVRKHGMRIRLQGQPFAVLAVLLESPGSVVTRDELQKRLWSSDTFVNFDHGLNKAINKLREALGDSAENPRFVETVARQGYRFLADVREIDETPVPTNPPAIPVVLPEAKSLQDGESPARADGRFPTRLVWLVAGVAALVIAAAALLLFIHKPATASARIQSLAVLPFESISNDSSQEYFADGMTDQLIADLGQISALRVISRTSVMSYKHVHKPLPQIARELNVDAVVEGTVQRSGDRVRITAQLIEAAHDGHLWSKSYEGELRNTLELQSDVASTIANQINIKVAPQERSALENARQVNPEAYVSYLKGRFFWNKRTPDSLRTALAYFNQAVEEDPRYAQAYSGLSDTYALLGDWQYAVMTPKDALPKAKAAALKALELDPSLGEAHNSLAFSLDGFDWDLNTAGREFQRAIELNPGYATAHHWYAWHLALLHDYDQALTEMRKAQSLDPLSLVINADLAELLAIAHSYDESIQQSQRTIELDPNFGLAHNHLGQAYLQKHMYAEAITELEKAVQLSGGSPTCMANLARAYAASGQKPKAMKLVRELEDKSNGLYSHGSDIAMIYAALGDRDQAMIWLQKGYDERFNPGVLLRPGLDPLRSDARFVELVKRVGLPN
jgi:TolB-like protein/DNA-binding winged helix-turn-helix (wHTH) protein/Flp pilus assembly protein TadD